MKRKLLAAICALAAASPATAAWQEASSRHFVVYADDTPQNIAIYTEKLERFDKALRVLRGMSDPETSPMARVTVFVVPNVRAVQKLGGRGMGDIAGFYTARASGSVAFVPRRTDDEDLSALVVLLHEYSHHMMFANWDRVAFPAWFVEGFAEFNATATFSPDGGVVFGNAPNYRAYGILDSDDVPLTTLLTADPNQLGSEELRQTFYGRAWLLTHYMTMDAERRSRLGAYFTALNSGKSAAEAGKLIGDPHKTDLLLNAYALKPRLAAFGVQAALLAIAPVHVRALTPGEAAVMPARIASARGVDKTTAHGVLAMARKAAAPFPDDPAAQNELAEAEYDAGNFKEAQAAADRALAADPKSIHAMIYEGMARIAIAGVDKTTDPKTWVAARGWFTRANRLDTEYALPLELYYESFLEGGQTPTANAQAALVYAHALAPYDMGLGMNAALVLLRQDKPAEAITMLKPIAYNPHGGDFAAGASALIAAVEKGGAKGGLALLDRPKDGADKAAKGTK